MISVTLPWPPREASPNWRGHFMAKARAARQYREDAHILTIKAHRGKLDDTINRDVRVTFYEPDKRGRDIDNMLGSTKAGLDGIAAALGLNDKRFMISLRRGEVRKGGAVVVEIET